ncbi:MAG: prepilin-type N-terminal cleavage/methylation domain-containing protein [Bradymonadia bacterium]
MQKLFRRAFTLIELMVVICILSVLATIAVIAYQRIQRTQYDDEALAGLSELYAETSRLVADWGICNAGDANCRGVSPRCYVSTAPNGAFSPNTLQINRPASSHWDYHVCVGSRDGVEAFYVLANLNYSAKATRRAIVMGSALHDPLIDIHALPGEIRLDGANVNDAIFGP